MTRTLLRRAGLLFGFVLALQLVPVARSNPPVTAPLDAPPEITGILRRACHDCHSNETVWPWYSRVAPASWLVALDVSRGREHLNFSTFASLPASEQRHMYEEIAEAIERGAMPPGIYTPLHPEARLGLGDIGALARWARASAGEP